MLTQLGIAFGFVTLIAWVAIGFTGEYPPSLYGFSLGVACWSARVAAYALLFADEYPPFSMEAASVGVPQVGTLSVAAARVKGAWILKPTVLGSRRHDLRALPSGEQPSEPPVFTLRLSGLVCIGSVVVRIVR